MISSFRRPALHSLFRIGLAMGLACPAAYANVATVMFQDNMVLQRRMAVPVFGTAAAGEEVAVGFRGQTKTVRAGMDGKWMVKLDATEAGGPFEMVLKGANTLTLKNVMVGEVWLCGGQSNMEWSMNSIGGANQDSAKLATFPDIRVITMQFGRDKWAALTPEIALNFSATAYYFGKNLHTTLNIPIGLVSSSVGGTAVERWLDPAVIAADPALAKDTMAGDLYRKWIAPVQPYGIRGAIWYQGESNANGTAPLYRSRIGSLITGWRKVWNQGDFPFYFVQIANYMALQTDPGETSLWADIREAQRQSLLIPNTAMAVAIDIGNAGNIHPVNKWDIGRRLALPARHLIYGRLQDSAHSGPTFDTCEKRGSLVRIHFKHAHGGLLDKSAGTLKGFALAGADNKWYWAAMLIRKDTVILSSSQVPAPTKVRYAWANNPAAVSLFNGAGLPASPFQADIPKEVPTALLLSTKAKNPGPSPLGSVTADANGRRAGSEIRKPKVARFQIKP